MESSEVTVRISVPFKRGDTDQNGMLNITDAVFILRTLFGGQGSGECPISLDTDADSKVLLTDAVFLLRFLFLRGLEPPPPFRECGQPTEAIPAELVCRALC